MHLREVQLLLTELACDRQDYASPSVWTTANSIAHHPAQNGTSADNIFRLDTCTPVKHTRFHHAEKRRLTLARTKTPLVLRHIITLRTKNKCGPPHQ